MGWVEAVVELLGIGYLLPGGLADGDDSLVSLSWAGGLYELSPKKRGGPYGSLGGLLSETCGVAGSVPLLAAEYLSTGAAETERAKARMALWKADFMFVDELSR